MKENDNVIVKSTGEWGTIVHLYPDGLTAEVEIICSHSMQTMAVETISLKDLKGKDV